MSDDDSDARWDLHSDRQLAVSKGGAAAVTVLNTGSWLALLSQASSFEGAGLGGPIVIWALGAFLGTLIWLLIYRGTMLSYYHDVSRDDDKIVKKININIAFGVTIAVGSLLCFAIGAAWLGLVLGF